MLCYPHPPTSPFPPVGSLLVACLESLPHPLACFDDPLISEESGITVRFGYFFIFVSFLLSNTTPLHRPILLDAILTCTLHYTHAIITPEFTTCDPLNTVPEIKLVIILPLG